MSRSHTNNINRYIIAHGKFMIDVLSISFITNCVFAYLFSYHFSLQVAYGYCTTNPNNFIYSLLFITIFL